MRKVKAKQAGEPVCKLPACFNDSKKQLMQLSLLLKRLHKYFTTLLQEAPLKSAA